MEITISKEKLIAATSLAERLVGKKESLPVLSCVLLDVSDVCTVRSTNLEAGIEIQIPCEVKEKGTVALPAGILSQTIRSISGDKVSIQTDEGNVRIESKGTRTLIKAIAPDEFPHLEGSRKQGVSVPRSALLSGIQAVSYAASPSMIRPELGSVLVSLRAQSLVCVATDSFRLAEKTIPASISEDGGDILIPLKHAVELVHVLERIMSDTVEVVSDDSQLTVSGDGTRFVSRVIDGTFPNYKDIIPKDTATTVTVLRADVVDMLRKARVFAGAESQVGLHMYPKRKVFTATAQSATVGEMDDSLEAALSGEDLDINFHIGYLSDCLSSIPSDSITLSFAGVGRPLVIREIGDASFLYLVMPLNR
jgi:DNA polymerase-3 subunit beta